MKRLLLAAMAAVLAVTPAAAQTVVLVRHAEKVDGGEDPILSGAGQARAAALAEAMADAHPGYVLISPLQRTRLTAAPTADFHAASIEPVGLEGGGAAHVAAVAERIRALPRDAVVLVVGHSNTIPPIARALGYEAAADMPECEYDRLTVLQLDGERTTAVVGRYGAPANC